MVQRMTSWLVICFFVLAAPSDAAPSITSFTYLTNVANYFYSIELTFSEPVTYSSDTVSVTVHDTSNTISNPNYYPTLSTTGISPVGSVSNFITFTFGTNLYQSFTSLTIGAGLAKSPDNIGSEIFSSTMATLTLSAGVAPMLTAFNYDVSLGMITLKFSTYVRFASFNPAGISLTNKNGTTIPVIPVSSVPDPLHPYNNVLLTLPVQDTVWLATSPWIGANVSLLYLNLPQAAITDYYGLAVAAETAMPVTNLTRPCYNPSTYFNSVNGDCEPCDPGCTTCSGPLSSPNNATILTGCRSCQVVILNEPSTYQCVRAVTCPDGYYQSNDTTGFPLTTTGAVLCRPCNTGCFTCTNSTHCTSCVGLVPPQPSYPFLPSRPPNCCANVTGGPPCSACNDSCIGGCHGPLNTQCVYCRELNYTVNVTTYCVSKCPPHTFQRGTFCLPCSSRIPQVLCPYYPCWLGYAYNPDAYECQLTDQFRYIVIPATCGGGGLLIILCGLLCALCWFFPSIAPDASDKRVYTNPTFSPESKSVQNPLLS